MKVKVNRELKNGQYIVRFAVSDFTPDELNKMQSFGVPLITMTAPGPQGARRLNVPITQVNQNLMATFGAEQDAKAYEAEILEQLKRAMTSLREQKDSFTDVTEVDI